MQVKLILYTKSEQQNVQKNVQKELTERQRNRLKILQEKSNITLEELSKRMSNSVKTIQRDMKVLQENGIIVREGSRTQGKWVICQQN